MLADVRKIITKDF